MAFWVLEEVPRLYVAFLVVESFKIQSSSYWGEKQHYIQAEHWTYTHQIQYLCNGFDFLLYKDNLKNIQIQMCGNVFFLHSITAERARLPRSPYRDSWHMPVLADMSQGDFLFSAGYPEVQSIFRMNNNN